MSTQATTQTENFIFTVEDRDWLNRFTCKLDQDEASVGRNSLRFLEDYAAKRNANRLGFRALLFSGLEAIVFREFLRMRDKNSLETEIDNVRARIRRLMRFRDAEFPPLGDGLPTEMVAQLPGIQWQSRIRAAITDSIESAKFEHKRLVSELAAHDQNRNNPKQDTFAVARLRAGLLMITGSQYDSHVANLLAVASHAAARTNDTWNPSKLQKIDSRFAHEYGHELPDLLYPDLFMMHVQVYPGKEIPKDVLLRVVPHMRRVERQQRQE